MRLALSEAGAVLLCGGGDADTSSGSSLSAGCSNAISGNVHRDQKRLIPPSHGSGLKSSSFWEVG